MSDFLKREPVLVIHLITTVIETGLALGITFGLTLSNQQLGAIMAFVVAVGNLSAALLARSQVTPVADPRDNNGNPLKAVVSPTLSQANASMISS